MTKITPLYFLLLLVGACGPSAEEESSMQRREVFELEAKAFSIHAQIKALDSNFPQNQEHIAKLKTQYQQVLSNLKLAKEGLKETLL